MTSLNRLNPAAFERCTCKAKISKADAAKSDEYRTLLEAKSIATRNKEATRGSCPYYYCRSKDSTAFSRTRFEPTVVREAEPGGCMQCRGPSVGDLRQGAGTVGLQANMLISRVRCRRQAESLLLSRAKQLEAQPNRNGLQPKERWPPT